MGFSSYYCTNFFTGCYFFLLKLNALAGTFNGNGFPSTSFEPGAKPRQGFMLGQTTLPGQLIILSSHKNRQIPTDSERLSLQCDLGLLLVYKPIGFEYKISPWPDLNQQPFGYYASCLLLIEGQSLPTQNSRSTAERSSH